MKRILLFFWFSTFFSLFAYTQQINEDIVSTTGGSFTNGINSIDWTIGEPIIGLIGLSSTLNQGFFQVLADDLSTNTTNVSWDFGLSLSPNPVNDFAELSTSNILSNTKLTIVDVNGVICHSLAYEGKRQKLDLTILSDGMYVLIIQQESKYQALKFIRTTL